MRATRNTILVRIDKEAQRKKRETIAGTSLYRHIDYAFMQCNLQHGEIISIGENAAKLFPEAQIGDFAVFKHTVEGDPDINSSEHLVDTLPNGDEIRCLDTSLDANYTEENIKKHRRGLEMFGVIKKDTDEFIPGELHVFFETKIRRYTKRPTVSSGILLDEKLNEDDSQLRKRVEDLKKDLDRLSNTYSRTIDPSERADIGRVLEGYQKESERITTYLNSDKIASAVVFAINSKTSRELKVKEGDTVLVVEDYLDALEIRNFRMLRILKEDVIGKVLPLSSTSV